MVALMRTALAQHQLSGLSKMLQNIAAAVDCFGCILWEVMSGSDMGHTTPEGRLVVLAQWFQGGVKSVVRTLPFRSATGKAIITGKPVNVLDVATDPRVWKKDPFLLQNGIRSICSVPVTLADKTRAALNLYRLRPFSRAEVEQIRQLASLVPGLYGTIKDKVSFNVVRSINRLLQGAELEIGGEGPVQNAAEPVLKAICTELASALRCVEVSVFLEDPLDHSGVFTLAATTWRGEIRRREYEKDPNLGLTGWALANSKPVRIFDLLHFDRDASIIQKEYPGITWQDSFSFRSVIGKVLQLPPGELPPLSYIASPIVTGGRTLGVIRCCTARQEPYYFGNRELRLQQLAGAQIGQYWSGLLAHRELSRENISWRRLAESVAQLNSLVHRELMLVRPEEGEIFAEALRLVHSVIPGAEIMDVRLLDEQSRELHFAETYGEAWDAGTPEEISMRKARRFRVDGESAGAHVYRTGEAYEVEDAANDPHYSQTFRDVRRLIVSPIKVEDKVIGVLDIRATGVSAFPEHAKTIAELLGQQLGLYHYLVSAISRLRVTEAELKTNMAALRGLQEQQAQTFEDLEHQLKSPIVQAYARVQAALSGDASSPKHRSNLQAIRGLCARARRVAISTGLFARLARSEPIEARLATLRYDDLIKSLVAAAMDNELTVEQARNISFVVDRSSFNVVASLEVRADQDLLGQAVGNLLDNAAKYSFANTKVRIYGGLTKTQRFHVSVINKGLQIRSAELQQCVERGWRSENARLTTGEGAGIGLWIVNHIMSAQGGELVIIPTDDQGFTEAKLVFPCRKMY
jgi:signal transduction histidine kinase